MVALSEPLATGRAVPIPLAVRLKAQNLYLVHCLEPIHVAKQTGLSRQQVSDLANREGWAKLRKEKILAAKLRTTERTAIPLDEVSDAIARKCDEHALTALDRTGRSLASKGKFAARDAQSFSGALANLVKVGRTVRGLDRGGSEASPTINLGFFFNSTPRSDPVNVTPAAQLVSPESPVLPV